MFTAVSGSGGAQLRFSNATPADIDRDPQSFVRALHYVNVPPDCLFTVRFSGTTSLRIRRASYAFVRARIGAHAFGSRA